jgi:hypothetical protein
MLNVNEWNDTRDALVGIAKYTLDHKTGKIDGFLHSSDKIARIVVCSTRNGSLVPRSDHSR